MINLLTRVLPSIPRRVFGETWTGRDSNRRWAKVAMSGNGQYQIAYTDSIGAGSNQLYVSNDYGSTWTAKESPRVWSDIKLSFDGQIQVALENAAGSGRIYVSVNFGNTWQARGPVNAWTYVALSLTGEKMTVVSSGISGALYFSSDFGTTWTSPVNPPWDGLGVGAFKGIAMNAAGDKQTAAAGNYIYISSDFGATWTNPLYRWNVSQPVISSNAQIQMLYGAETQFQTFPQINVSVDFGATWAKKEYITTRDWRRLAISADGTRAAGIVGGNQIFVSSNTGNTWTSKLTVDPFVALILLEMSSNGKNLIAGAYRQLYVSTDYGENWALKYLPAALTDLKISSDGTHGTATLTTEKIYTTQRTRLI